MTDKTSNCTVGQIKGVHNAKLRQCGQEYRETLALEIDIELNTIQRNNNITRFVPG